MAEEETKDLATRILLTVTVIFVVIAPVVARVAVTRGQTAVEVERPWVTHLELVDRALAERNMSAAVHAWQDAYAAAARPPRWEGLLDVGDASLRIGETPALASSSLGKARGAYLAGLFRARHQGSLEGVLRAAGAFAALGDRDVVQGSLRIAAEIATRHADGEAMDQVRTAGERLMARLESAL
jgi:hypothetical protein